MSGIIDFLVGLGEVIGALLGFVFDTISDLFYVIGLLSSLLIHIGDMIGWLPSACISLVVTTFGIVLIYKILGREG